MDIDVRQGDCLEVLPVLDAESVDLVYLDPPFFTQKVHKLRTRDRTREFSFDDLWASHEDYARFLYDRLIEMKRTLKSTGSVFFHCDRNASHIVRALLDDIFGYKNFRSEVIWKYRRWSNSQRNLLPSHQTLFFYSKSSDYKFNTIYQEYSPSTNIDQILQRRKRDEHGKSVYDRDENGTVVSNGPKKGVPLNDVWDIPYLNPKAKERAGYPTQKPILLLDRIITLVTSEGDVVLDPFCGSGTTLIAAMLSGRKAIGIDSSKEAVALTHKRLNSPIKTESALLENGRDSYRNADEDALAYLQSIDCIPVHRNKGIDAILTEQVDGRPVPLRVQRQNESISEAADLLWKAGQTKHANLMILIEVHENGQLGFELDLPPNVEKVSTPGLLIKKMLLAMSCDFVKSSTTKEDVHER